MCLPQAEYCCHSKTAGKKKGGEKKDRKLHIFLIIFSQLIGKCLLVSVNLEKDGFPCRARSAGPAQETGAGCGCSVLWMSTGGRSSGLSCSLHTKGTSPKVTLPHSRLTWPPLPGCFQPCAPVNLAWPRLGAAQEIILAPLQSQFWIHSQPLQLCLRKALGKRFWLLIAQTLQAKSCSALHCASPVTFCLTYIMAGCFWPFILALEVSVKCQKLPFIIHGAIGIRGNRPGVCTFRFPGNLALLIHVFSRKQWKVLFKAKI